MAVYNQELDIDGNDKDDKGAQMQSSWQPLWRAACEELYLKKARKYQYLATFDACAATAGDDDDDNGNEPPVDLRAVCCRRYQGQECVQGI